jgi:hypothetical protein
MRPKAFLMSTGVGGLTVFLTGIVMFALPPFQRLYTYAMTAGAATGVPREVPILWAILVGALAYGALVTLAMGNRTHSIVGGLKTGATVGILLWATADFMLYGISHVGNLTSALLDPIVELVPGAIAGALIAVTSRMFGTTGRSGTSVH